MQVKETFVELAAGVIGGIVATQVNGVVEKVFWQATPPDAKAREPELADGSSAGAAARMLLETPESSPPEKELQVVKKGIHYGLGAAWGPLYCALRRNTSMGPVAAGVTSGLALSVIVDETLNPLLRITPPPDAYPASAHVRGLLTHATWGLVCAATAESVRRRLST